MPGHGCNIDNGAALARGDHVLASLRSLMSARSGDYAWMNTDGLGGEEDAVEVNVDDALEAYSPRYEGIE